MRVLVDIAATIRMAESADAVAFLRFAVKRVKEKEWRGAESPLVKTSSTSVIDPALSELPDFCRLHASP